MKVGLYFGSFNPIHTGHCIIASFMVTNTNLDQVWFVVSPQNPLKTSATLLNEYHRLHLVNLAIEQERELKASDIEFQLPKPSFTIDTLTYLTEKHPGKIFTLIMGSDSYQNLPKWKNATVILRDYDICIYERPGFPVTSIADPRHKVLKAPMLDISATHIREMIREKKSISFLVPDAVKAEIENNGYYR